VVRDRHGTPNALLNEARRRMPSPSGSGRCMSRQELAEAVNAHLWQEHEYRSRLDANYVGKLERGEHRWPTDRHREGFRAVLGAATDADLGFYIIRSPRQGPPSRGEHAIPAVSAALSARRHRSIACPPVEVAELLDHLREQWYVLVRADNLLGPRHALVGVQAQLEVLTELMEADPGELRAEAVRLGAQYAESAAWLHEDAGDLPRAQAWTSQAMEWAYEIDDAVMVAWTAYRRSQQLTATGHTAAAVGLARAARRDDGRLPGPMRAAVRVQEAHGLALSARDNERDALRLFDDAHAWAADDQQGDARGGHGSFCTASYIEIHRAVCLGLLRRPREAITLFDQALPALPSVYRRDRAAALASKAAAHAAADEPELAAVAAHSALPTARRAGSRRIVRQIEAVGAALARHRKLEPVAALLDDLAQSTA